MREVADKEKKSPTQDPTQEKENRELSRCIPN